MLDPGIAKLAQAVLKGRMAEMRVNDSTIDGIGIKFIFPAKEDRPNLEFRKADLWLSASELFEYGLKLSNTPLDVTKPVDQLTLRKLSHDIKKGEDAHKVIVNFHDWLLSTLHPLPLPIDATSSARDPSTVFNHNHEQIHPSAINPSIFCGSDEASRSHQYCLQCDETIRHNCNSYCLKRRPNKKEINNVPKTTSLPQDIISRQSNPYLKKDIVDSKSSIQGDMQCRFDFPYNRYLKTFVRVRMYVVGKK